MSVLPSFKATFSTYADDIAFAASAPSSSPPRQTSCHERQRTTSFPQPPPAASPPSSSSRPPIAPLPLHMVDIAQDAPAFGFASRTPKREMLEPLPIDVLDFPVNDNLYIQTTSLKRSIASSQAPTQKRCRSQSLFADSKHSFDHVSLPPVSMPKSHVSSGLDHIQSATPSLTPSLPPPSTSNSSRRHLTKLCRSQTPTSSSPLQLNPPCRSSDTVLPPITDSILPNPASPRQTNSNRPTSRPDRTNLSLVLAPALNPNLSSKSNQHSSQPSSCRHQSSASDDNHDNRRTDMLIHQSTLSLSRGIAREGPLSIFRTGSFSTNAANSDDKCNNSKARSRSLAQNSSRVHAVEFVEDSTGRAPVDVLSIPGERSLPSASALSARTMQPHNVGPNCTGNSGGLMALPLGPTTSDLHFMCSAEGRRARNRTHTLSDLVDGTERIVRAEEPELRSDSPMGAVNSDEGRGRACMVAFANGHAHQGRQSHRHDYGVDQSYTKLDQNRHSSLKHERTIRSGETTTTTHVGCNRQKPNAGNDDMVEDMQPVAMPSDLAKAEAEAIDKCVDSEIRFTTKVEIMAKTEVRIDGSGVMTGDTDEEDKMGLDSGLLGTSRQDDEFVQCPSCPRRLRNQVTLQNHIKVVHDNNGNFRCSQCGLTFMWRSTLSNHVRLVHEKQRPYACQDCGKGFRWKSHLREHVWVVHKGEKPFQCETCGKTFGRKNNMQKHMRKHTSGNPNGGPNTDDS